MKFLHTGDLHLDSAFCRYGALDADRLRERGRSLLRRIFACATEENCDMLLVAGDLFDSRVITPETERLVCSLVAEFGRPVVVAPGNHDPYEAGSFWRRESLPDNLYIFNSKELQCFEFPSLGTTVFGYAFLSPSFPERPLLEATAPAKQEGEIRLLCAHGDLSDPLSRYAPITGNDLLKFSFDYAALGHVHNRAGSSSLAQYCGFPEGRSFDEEGEGGVMLISVTDGLVTAERRCLSRIQFRTAELDVSGCESPEELETRLNAFTDGLGVDPLRVHLRISLTGMMEAGVAEEWRMRESEVRGRYASFELRDHTTPAVSGEYLMRDPTIRGAFYRVLLDKLRGDDPKERELALRALRIGLLAIDGKSFTDPNASGGGRG